MLKKAGGFAVLLALAAGVGALLYLAGAFDTNSDLSGQAVAVREDPAPAPEPPRPGRLQIFVADAETKAPITEFKMRREPAPSANWLANKSADGRIELSGFLDRRMRLNLRANGYLPSFVELLYANVPEDGVMKAVTVLLEPGYDLNGFVVDDATGSPIPGAHVRAMASVEKGDFEDYPAADPAVPVDATDEDGHYRLTVTPPAAGRYIVAWADNYAVTLIEQDLAALQHAVEFRLQPGGNKTFLLRQSGELVGRMDIHLDQPQFPEATHVMPLRSTSRQDHPAVFRHVPQGIYRATLRVPGSGEWGRAVIAIAPDVAPTTEWDVDEFGGLFGTIEDYDPEVPVRVSIVDARFPFVPIFDTAPDEAGLFEFGFLPPGPYSVRVAHAGSKETPNARKYNVVNGEWREILVSMPDTPAAVEVAPADGE